MATYQFTRWFHDRHICEFVHAADVVEAVEVLRRQTSYTNLFFEAGRFPRKLQNMVTIAQVIEDGSQK